MTQNFQLGTFGQYVSACTTSNSITLSSNTVNIGNSSVNVSINSTSFSGTANNSTYLNGQLASYYTNASNITTGTLPYAQIPANIINTTASFTRTGITTFSANIVLGSSGVSSNGGYGTAGHVLHSNGSATYWAADDQGVTSVATSNGIGGGTITSTGTLYAIGNTGVVANSSGLFVNSNYIATIGSNSANYANASISNTFTVGTASYFVSNGNVGIGTSSPSSLLHLSTTGPAILTLEADTDNITETDNARIVMKQDGGAVVGRIGYANNSNYLEIINQYADGLQLGANNTSTMYLVSNGNVGIGTSSPSSPLTVASGSAQFPTAISILASTHATSRRGGIFIGDWLVYQDASGNGIKDFGIYDSNASATRFFISNTGNIGIGTGSPSVKLHVYSTSLSDIRSEINSSAGNVARFSLVSPTSNYAWLTSDNTNALALYDYNASAYRMYINSSGNIGIGTTSQIAKLDIAGDLRSTSYYYINNSSPTIFFQDTDHRSAMLHCNENYFYLLRGDGNNSTTWATYNGYFPTQWNLSDNSIIFGGVATAVTDFRAPIFYDSNDTSFYIDPATEAKLKHITVGPYAGSSTTGGVVGLEIKNNGGTGDSNLAAIAFHCTGAYATHMHLRADGVFGIGGWTPSAYRWYLNLNNGQMNAVGNIWAGGNLVADGSSTYSTVYYDRYDSNWYLLPANYFKLKDNSGGYNVTFTSATSGLLVGNAENNGSTVRIGAAWTRPGIYVYGDLNLMTDGGNNIVFVNANANKGYIDVNGTMYAYNYGYMSDIRLKKNVQPITFALDKIKLLNGKKYQWNEKANVPNTSYEYGFLANEVENVIPELVTETIMVSDEGDKYKAVSYTKLIPFLVEAMKEQQTQIEDLKKEIELLKKG